METTLDLSRCREKPRGVAYRRWVITSTGLRRLFSTKFFLGLLIVAWTAGIAMAAFGFAFSQTVVTGGWLEQGATQLGPRAQAVASAVGALVLLYPDICVSGLFTMIFWAQSFLGLWLCLIGLTVLVPQLVTRDRASNALIIYLARPLTSVDYLLGKLGIIAGMLVMLWTGPLLFGWALSMLFAPNSDFFVYSFTPLMRALLFNGISLVVLASVALGISSLTRSSRTTIMLWISAWIIAGFLALTTEEALRKGRSAPEWLLRASFTHNIAEVRKSVLQLDEVLIEAGSKLPLLDQNFAEKLKRNGREEAADNLPGTLMSLGFFVALSSVVFLRKLRPE
jgi:ABC-2 type transport system permease protein